MFLNIRDVCSHKTLLLNLHGEEERELGEDGERQPLHNCEFSKLTSISNTTFIKGEEQNMLI